LNLFWEDTLEGELQSFKPADELTILFDSYGLDPEAEIITYCQAGGRAAHELFVLYLMGYDDLRLYLGSMEDWSRQPTRPLQ
jgi:thiosulfate/3-mercaptopyruvate sulfurtransferase